MTNKVVDEIKKDIVRKLKTFYGFCGLADNDNSARINSSDDQGNDIIIHITIKPE